MASMRATLQKEVFAVDRESLLGIVLVTSSGRKKKQLYLCATVSTELAQQAAIHKVKKPSEKEPFKKKVTWKLQDLREVDGKDSSPDNYDFDLRFDKVYRWTATSASEKKSFIVCLWKLCHKFLTGWKKPEFVHVNKYKLEEQLKAFDSSRFGTTAAPAAAEEEYQQLTPKEEADLEKILAVGNSSISNAEAFTDKLIEQLDQLDVENRQAILRSEDEVESLLKTMDGALRELGKIEHEIETYDCLLQEVREAVEYMDDKDKRLQIEDQNYKRLLGEVQSLVDKLDIGREAEELLRHGDLNHRASLERCTEAALALRRAQSIRLSPGLTMLAAVMQQKENFSQLAWGFIQRLSTHLGGVFAKQGDDGMDVLGQHRAANAQVLILRSHNSYHRELLPYSKLMGWLKKVDSKQFTELYKKYVGLLGKVYEKEIKEFMEAVKHSLFGKSHEHKKGLLSKLSTSNASLVKSMSRESLHMRSPAGPSASLLDLTSRFRDRQDSPSAGQSSSSADERQKFDNAFVMVLEQLEPLCKDEQDFCTELFCLGSEKDPKEVEEGDSPDSYWRRRKKIRSDKSAKAPAAQLTPRGMTEEIFSTLEFELQRLIEFGDKLDGFNSLCMLVRVSQHMKLGKTSQGNVSYLSLCLGKHLIIVKRLFDTFVANRVRWTGELKVPKKQKCGILPCVTKFEEFATQAEEILRESDRRADLDRAYKSLMDSIVGAIDRISSDHQKTPSDVIIFENFHHLYDMLARLKINSLDVFREQAKQQYKVHLESYVHTYLGKPLDKLTTFIEGIENLVASGVKHEEVGYQLAFSKAELKKIVKEYPGDKVRKGLESLYRKVEKHLCEEENLLQVVWHKMQDEFLGHCKRYEELVAKCYPGSKIMLEFSVDNLLSYFSMIAQQH